VIAVSESGERQRFALRRDVPVVRETLRRIRQTEQLVALNLFDRRKPVQTLDYLERRTHNRASMELPIYVMPVDFDGRHTQHIEGSVRMPAITKDVSLRGIGFTHDEPFDGHYAIVTLEWLEHDTLALLVEVRWSNLKKGISMMSGGMFLGVAQPSSA